MASPGLGLALRGGAVVLFFLSGVAGLVYQVIWVRRFGAVFGNTLHSAALVTGVFMCGLGVGSYLVGRHSDRRHGTDPIPPLRLYGYSELAIAAWGMVLTVLLPRLVGLSARLSSYQIDDQGWFGLSLATYVLHYAVAVVALAPPCLVMGGTLTLLIRFMIGTDLATAGWRVGLLYGINTAGAALGALLTDFLLVPTQGVYATQLVAVALNLVAGLGALGLARRPVQPRPGRAVAPEADAPDVGVVTARDSTAAVVPLAALALALSGFAAMGVEMLWFRYLSQILGQLRAVFSLLLAVMLVGIWLGSFASGYVHRRWGRPALWFVVAQTLLVVVTLGLLGGPDHHAAYQGYVLTIRPEYAAATSAARAGLALWAALRPIVVVVALPSFLMGFAFPLANATVQRAQTRVGGRAGMLYLANTLGNVLGASLVGFVLLPGLGIRWTTIALCGCAAVSVVPLFLAAAPTPAARNRGPTRFALAGGLLAASLSLFAFWLAPPDRLLRPTLPRGDQGGTRQIIAFSEGPHETIVVTDVPGYERKLFTNGHPMSGTSPTSQRYMRAFAHLPLLQMDRPKRALVICFGVGNTLHAASLHPSMERLEAADLSRHVLQHASFFEASNRRVLADPRVAVFVNDGRHHLLMQPPDSYDLVTLEPPPITFAGVAALYSRDFYALVRSRLTPGGYLTQWLPAYQVREPTVLALVKAFVDVFPQTVLLSGDDKELILMGTRGPTIQLDLPAVAARLKAAPAVQADLDGIQMGRLVELAGTFVASATTLRAATYGVRAVTDDRPSLEYSELSGLRATRMPAQLFDVGGVEAWCPDCTAQLPGLDDYLGVLAAIYGSDAYLSAGLMSRADGSVGSFTLPDSPAAQQAIAHSAYLQRMVGPRSTGAKRQARVLLAQGSALLAIGVLHHAIYLSPEDPEGHALLGRALTAAGDEAAGIGAHRVAVQLDPGNPAWRLELALALRRAGDLEGALTHYAQVVDLAPDLADGRYLYAAALQAAGQGEEADRQLAQCLRLAPRHPRANLVMCKRAAAANQIEAARRHCALAAEGGVPIPPQLSARLERPTP